MSRAPLLAAVAAALLAAAPAAAASPRPLHAVPDPARGGRIADDRGREVLLRGVNVNALAEYWAGTAFPTTFPLAPGDPARMRRIGWNAVRLLVSWSRVEPGRGRYDAAYLDAVARTARRLAAAGLHVILDVHQDAWGPSLAARPGETCPAGASPALGWDGAPGWATLDGGERRCAIGGQRELSPAVLRAWGAFFADEQGIQSAFVAMLGRLARHFRDARHVAGIDVLNEPGALSEDQRAALSRLYARALRAIRGAGGRRKLVLFEPPALWSSTGRGAPPDFARDRDVVYAPHLYTGGFDGGPITAEAFRIARAEARGFGGAPVLSGEWGGDPDRAGPAGDRYFAEHQRLQDRFRVSATLWTWRESCGDPHKAGDLRAGRVPEVWGLFEVDCRTNAVLGPRRALVRDLTRPYVRAAPGRLELTRFDARRGALRAAGSGARRRAGPLLAFWPRRLLGAPRVRATGLRAIRVRGDLVLARPRGGRWALRITG